jgi:hypothetical protein
MITRQSVQPFGLFFEEPAVKVQEYDIVPTYDDDAGLSFVERLGKRIPLVEAADVLATGTETKAIEQTDADPDDPREVPKPPIRTNTFTELALENTDSD